MGATQGELTAPLVGSDREQSNAAAAQRIGRLAGAEYPQMAALAETSRRSTMAADFDRALDMLLTGIQTQTRKNRRAAAAAKPKFPLVGRS
jgi:hypothetical protein